MICGQNNLNRVMLLENSPWKSLRFQISIVLMVEQGAIKQCLGSQLLLHLLQTQTVSCVTDKTISVVNVQLVPKLFHHHISMECNRDY